MLKKSKVCTALMLAFGGSVGLTVAPAFAQQPAAQPVERVEVTGSRIKRADVEGALPVTVINRAELEASGSTTVAEFMRSTTFSSAGNFRPQSGSSAQSFAGIDLRGLGSERTLVLLDGRRLPKAPNVGDSVDLNTVPMAAVERIEILTDGASAVYGSDAIGGVVNIITRKDFEGLQMVVGYTRPKNDGGAKKEASVLLGVNGEKGRVIMGASKTGRAMVYTHQRPWGQIRGVTSYGNNYLTTTGSLESVGYLRGTDPSVGCTDPNFYVAGAAGTRQTCGYDFNKVAADEAQIDSQAFFARGETTLSNDWKAYASASATNTTSFGRYAPTPAQFQIAANTPNNPLARTITVRHRTAAAGPRDTNTDAWLSNVSGGFQGKITNNLELDVGAAYTRSTYKELGRNYIVRPILEQYANSGDYDIFNPNANDPLVLSAIKATIGRDSLYKQKDLYAIATMYDLFQLAGGGASLLASVERRNEQFADVYDSLSEAGVIEGSAGNSAAGKRSVTGMAVEMVMPFTKTLEGSIAGRYDKYSDYGSDFSPKASVRWQPLKSLTVRASIGEGFRAPSLPQLNQKESFSAESVIDPVTCINFGGATGGGLPAAQDCALGRQVQVDSYTAANGALKSEKSKQYSIGAVWDATSYLSFKADFANIKISDKLTLIDAQDLIDRSNGSDPRAIPTGLYVTRNGAGSITRVQQGFANEGELNAQYLDISTQVRWKSAVAGSFSHELRYSNTLKYEDGGDEVRGTIGLPRYRTTLSNEWKLGAFGVTFNSNLIGRNGVTEARTANAYTTHDLQGTYSTPWKGKVVIGAQNIGNKQPELVAFSGRNFNFDLYDSYGRQVYVRLEQKF